jgi:integrase
MKLTKTAVDSAKPKAGRYRLNDSLVPGLSLLVLPSGFKTYYVRFRTVDGVQRELKLGTPVELTPDDARRLARNALAQVREGRDPASERHQMRKAPTMADLAARYMDRHGKRKRSGFNDEILWRRHILPAMERVKVARLTREQVRQFHVDHPSPTTANRAMEVLSKAMTLAEEWGWRPPGSNPCTGIKAHRENQRRRYMTADELARLRDALANWESPGLRWRFAQLVRLLLLTGARLREIMEGQWDWVDWERRVIEVPAEKGKTGASSIRLSSRAVEILRELRAASNSNWIIAGLGDGPLVGYRRLWLTLLDQAGITDLRVHDLRHTFASYSLSGGQTLGTVGQLLGHRSAQTTTRYAHLIDDAAHRAVAQVSHNLGV